MARKTEEKPAEELEDANGVIRFKLPHARYGQMYAVAEQELGGSRFRVICADGISRMARIPGKYKRRMWIKTGELLIITPWDIQNEKCDIVYRYSSAQYNYLQRKKILPAVLEKNKEA